MILIIDNYDSFTYNLYQAVAEIYRDGLKNREFGKEGLQNYCSERATIAERQGASENKNFEVNPTLPKTDSSDYFGMHPDVKVVRNDQITLEEIEKLNPNGIILSPGPGRPETAGICIELIRHFGAKVPILGVCLGHQAIAIAYGGKVIGSPEILHGKESLIFHGRKNLFKKMPLPFSAGRYHSLLIEKQSLPQDLAIEAETPEGLIMGVSHRKHPVYGVQFHPESILTPEGKTLIRQFLEICKC